MTPRLQVRKRSLHTRYWLLAGVLALGLSCQPEAGDEPSEPGLAAQAQAAAGQTQQTGEPMPAPGSIPASPVAAAPPVCARTITADVVALDQVYTYNRLGAFNPVGMIYALKHDVQAINTSKPIGPGNARLRLDKRPRPLVLRANVGDCLRITFTNWLAPTRAGIPDPQNSQPSPNVGQFVFRKQLRTWVPDDLYDALASMLAGSPVGGRWFEPREAGDFNLSMKDNSPFTREASVHVQGLQYVSAGSDGAYVGNNPSTLVAPGNTATYTYHADHEGTFFFYSMGASFGGQGDGGSTVMGLFGAVNVEPAGSKWYRSKVSNAVLVAAQRKDTAGNPLKNPDGTPLINYDAPDASGNPLLAILHPQTLAIHHGDLEAIITGYSSTVMGTSTSKDQGYFREITAIYHDEVKAVQAFDELEWNPTFHSVKDGFGINYGVAGLGAELLANRAKLGPTKNCTECLYEEFFLESWANGDPAMNVEHDSTGRAVRALYPDDPSNVHHSYLGDPVRIRNIHAGPAETHVFHLHAHQWKFSPGEEDSNYLDSQTIGPGSAFTYDINFGGSGNRNLTVGDSIHHCHLYPHFAQGMWALWRVHDVFEAGTSDRNLPDGEIAGGTPNPAVIPIPARVMPPMPTYAATVVSTPGGNVTRPAFPGYPFYIAGKAGHRPPQAPLDIQHDGGLPRHVVTSDPGPTTFGEPGKRFKVNHTRLNLKLLPQNGTPLEQNAMSFHAGSFPNAAAATTAYGDTVSSYPGYTASGTSGRFLVNGRPATGGAPYADPCPAGVPQRTYRAAYIQIALQRMNRAGWHDPQARIMVLNDDVAATRNGTRPAEPFFFRAQSGECINFHATNLIPRELLADDFQIYTPTDTIGQHIHLVKFDVTASDGAGNGWNYEDGTFAADEVLHRIDLANAAGGAFPVDGTLNETGTRVRLTPTTHPLLGVQGAQTTMQRWWADPLKNPAGVDKTVETVFTHDHFGPSSHQQHGLYGALIVEPEGSQWRDPRTGVLYGSRTSDGGPTSWRADVLMKDTTQHFREFALAFADFGLSYDECGKPVNPPNFKEEPLPIAIGFEDHPMPEAISSRDPGAMLINYRNEPIPLRISTRANCGDRTQRIGLRGDMANVFRSDLHGDPYTPLLRGYQGDKVKIRLIQGAQEEQHSFTMHGHKWLREDEDPDSGFVNGQAVGISEHFEFKLANGLPVVGGPFATADYMYQSASNGDLWNGMWGIMRTYKFRQRNVRTLGDVALQAADGQPFYPYDPVNLLPLPYPTTTSAPLPETWDEADVATRDAPETDTAYQGSYVVDDNGNAIEQRTVDYLLEEREKMASIDPALVQEAESKGRIGPGKLVPLDSCPNGARVRLYRVSAIDARNHLPNGRLVYNGEYKIYDPDAVIFVKNEHLAAVKNGTRKPEPLILRARAGECVQVTLTNLLPSTAPVKRPQWAHHSPITPNFNVNQVRPSTHVSLHPQLVNMDINTDDGANVGLNAVQTVAPGRSRTYRWYAGDLRRTGTGSTVTPVEFGIVNLRNMADVVNHGMHGSIGALIIEPANAVWSPDTDSEAEARVTYTKANGTTETFREFVLLFQDDLGLHTDDVRFQDTDGLNSGTALRNLAGADDAEDTGHKAFNYSTEPLWGRLGLPPQTDPETINDLNLSAILSSAAHGDPATPILRASRGERLRLRVGQPSGHARQHAFALHGVEWRRNPWATGATSRFMGDNATSPVISTQGGMSVMQSYNFVPLQPAGGAGGIPMDYLYRDMSSFQWSYGGLWGVVRVQ